MSKSLEILNRYWGFDSFRLGQDAIVEDVIYGHDVLALLPTGGGKSICFQVPGISREGITIVVSPLIALMQDQVNNLIAKGLRAKALISGMSYRELDITLDNARFGGLDFLYTSPERLQSPLFIERFKRMNVGLIVVDEAHCISEWGHDFRPSFREIKQLREHHPEVPIIALTATATAETQADIIFQLGLREPKVHRSAFERSNLVYQSFQSENKLQDILNECRYREGQTGIVYCQTRKSVKFVAKYLHAQGMSIGIYHGGMTREDRKWMLDEWLSGKVQVMVATNAFGMGIDKPDVRYVLHYEFPASLEAYFQEAGRGGRDGHEAYAMNFWQSEDIMRLKQQVEQKFPELDFVKKVYRAICNHLKVAIGAGNGESYGLDLKKLCSAFSLPASDTYNAIKLLETSGELAFSEGVYNPTRVKFAVGNTPLYNFQIQHEQIVAITTLLSRSYPGIFDNYFELHEKEFCKRLSISSNELDRQLRFLESYGILDITWKTDLPTVTFLRERRPDDYLELRPEVYLRRKELAHQKLEACVRYIHEPICRAVQLIEYFGMETQDCGKCDVCQSKKALPDFETTKQEILELLRTEPLSGADLKRKVANSALVEEILRELMVDELVFYVDGRYEWGTEN